MLSTIPSAQLGVELAFTSLNSEVEIDDLPIEGDIPRWLNGSLFRNGSAKFELGQVSYNHWFDGLAMVHCYSFRDSRIAIVTAFIHVSLHSNDVYWVGETQRGTNFLVIHKRSGQ
jgi:beta,beta-carotene 9',10'-dioxygenase